MTSTSLLLLRIPRIQRNLELSNRKERKREWDREGKKGGRRRRKRKMMRKNEGKRERERKGKKEKQGRGREGREKSHGYYLFFFCLLCSIF